jgi:4-hydroxy-4-methyl-2-oxoglutarate aldolase
VPVTVGGARIRPGDLVVLDADGVTVVAAERARDVLAASLEREAKEAEKRTKLNAGALTWELDGLNRRV